ncbi:MAG: hypothetical protein WCO84_03870 [bacterium]
MPEENTPTLDKADWLSLYLVAIFFDVMGWLMAFVDIFLLGWGGFFLNLSGGATFSLWLAIWKDKFGGFGKISTTFIIVFLLEATPIVGDVLPLWTGMIYRLQKNHEKNLMGTITGTIKDKATKKKEQDERRKKEEDEKKKKTEEDGRREEERREQQRQKEMDEKKAERLENGKSSQNEKEVGENKNEGLEEAQPAQQVE